MSLSPKSHHLPSALLHSTRVRTLVVCSLGYDIEFTQRSCVFQMFSNQKVSPGKSEVRIAFSLDSTSGKTHIHDLRHSAAMCSHTHTHTPVIHIHSQNNLNQIFELLASLAEPLIHSHCISTLSVYMCEILPAKKQPAHNLCPPTHMRAHHTHTHTRTLRL